MEIKPFRHPTPLVMTNTSAVNKFTLAELAATAFDSRRAYIATLQISPGPNTQLELPTVFPVQTERYIVKPRPSASSLIECTPPKMYSDAKPIRDNSYSCPSTKAE
jgi:hypothetical protein